MSRRCIFPLSPEEFNPRDTDDEWRAILKYLRTGKDPGHKARKALIRNLRDPDKPCPAFICRALADLFDAKPQRIKIKAHKPPAGSVKYWMAYFIFARIHFDAVEEAITRHMARLNVSREVAARAYDETLPESPNFDRPNEKAREKFVVEAMKAFRASRATVMRAWSECRDEVFEDRRLDRLEEYRVEIRRDALARVLGQQGSQKRRPKFEPSSS